MSGLIHKELKNINYICRVKNIFLISIIVLGLLAFKVPEKVMKKADKVISKYYEIDEFTKESIAFSQEINIKTPSEFGEDNFFKIFSENQLLGYGYIGRAPSKTADFDYLVLFDSNFIITKSKVLIYREEYGGEIGSKRWLKQFIGKFSDSPELIAGKSIVPISGATISVKSMTNAINDLLKSIKVLEDLNKI